MQVFHEFIPGQPLIISFHTFKSMTSDLRVHARGGGGGGRGGGEVHTLGVGQKVKI